jgi:uncharacterized protein YbbC (DUF1343 family)
MTLIFALTLGSALILEGPATAALSEASPRELKLDAARLSRIDDLVGRAIEARQVPGAVVLVGRHGKIAFVKAYGDRAVEPAREPMTRDTIFDMASLTKPVATATALMVLLERGAFRLDDPLSKHLPEFDNHGKGAITIDQLLRHRAGLIADNPVTDFADGPEEAWKRLANIDLMAKPGERFVYSDVGFMVLGRLVETLSGQPLDVFCRSAIYEPLGMRDTRFAPRDPEDATWTGQRGRIAPTEKAGDQWLRGVVHDPRARALGGVAGHAGLFGTADDLAIYAQMLLDVGQGPDGHRLLEDETVRRMTDPDDTPSRQRRGLGWDIATGYSAPRGTGFGPASFGHTGFTGTSLWIDPETRTFVILLTNRVHPDGKSPMPSKLRSDVATAVASAVLDAPAVHPVDCGVDVLVRRGFDRLRGKRVGLVTNHTGLAKDGRSTIDILFKAPDVKLVALFSPEHGIRGEVDRKVDDGKDELTGLPVFSLYGRTQRPSPESLEGVDALVYDIQDVGARFYTYITTLGLAMETAKARGIPFVVLDRPNPIGGLTVSGPVRDPEFASFIAYHALPVRHGMTVGELARLYNAERSIGADLVVVPCEGWRRSDYYDRTGLLWVNPSPNMRSLTEAMLYPGVCLLEACRLATGRGTDSPFERVGAPWIDPVTFATDLNGLGLPGVRFVPIRFAPKERQFSGESCGGVQILLTDWDRFDPLDLGIGMAHVLQARYGDRWGAEGFLKLVADRATYQAVLDGKDVVTIRHLWEPELAEFRRIRAKYLIYP